MARWFMDDDDDDEIVNGMDLFFNEWGCFDCYLLTYLLTDD